MQKQGRRVISETKKKQRKKTNESPKGGGEPKRSTNKKQFLFHQYHSHRYFLVEFLFISSVIILNTMYMFFFTATRSLSLYIYSSGKEDSATIIYYTIEKTEE